MDRGDRVELLSKRVVLDGIELGRVVDVILDDDGASARSASTCSCGDGGAPVPAVTRRAARR